MYYVFTNVIGVRINRYKIWHVSVNYILTLWRLSTDVFIQSSSYQGKCEPK